VGRAACEKRIAERNPLFPYSWAAVLRPSSPLGRPELLKQFNGDRDYHYAREIPVARVEALYILGHPHSPIEVKTLGNRPAPDEVLIGAHNGIEFEAGLTGIKDKWSIPYFGFRYGIDELTVEIDPAGDLWKVLKENGVETWRGKL